MNQKVVEYLKHYVQLYGLSFLALSFFTLLTGSLLTFHPQDVSLLYHARHGFCNNIFGYVGSSLAALVVYFWGSTAYMLLGFLGYIGLLQLRSKTWQDEIDRLGGMLLFLFVWSFLCNLYQIGFYEFSSFGGVVGGYLNSSLSFFDIQARFIIAYSLLFVSSVLMVRFAHLMVARWVVIAVSFVVDYMVQLDHLPARMVRATASCIAQACFALHKMYRYCADLLNGVWIKRSSDTIVDFEREQESGQNVDQIMQDMFGQEHQSFEQESENNKNHFEDEVFPSNFVSHDEQVADNSVSDEAREFEEYESAQLSKVALINPEEIQKAYELPNIEDMLAKGVPMDDEVTIDQTVLDEQSAILEEKLSQFGIKGHVVRVHPGPVITMFEYKPESNIKLSKILALEDDLAMALQAISIRILAPIPGKPVVGFEVANKVRKPVMLSNIFHSKAWTEFEGKLPLILGENTHGEHIVVDLASMPHVLIAGSTGSGKSVAVNCMLISLLCAKKPEQVRLIIIDPKQLEFASYDDIAHLLFPIITDSKKAVPVLKWLVNTMEERYELMAEHGVKNIFEYQELAEKNSNLDNMPFIVLIIDELADLMMTTGKEIEDLIARIAQMSRAAGIHMIVATQRPSVDVITGLIKVNFPNRISFKVTSKVDSRTILDSMGAERLLGKGDMLFVDAKNPEISRVHGAYVSNREIEFLVEHIKHQQDVKYLDLNEILTSEVTNESLLEADQELYEKIADAIKEYDEVSISMIQRKFRIGYNRSARIMEALEADGLIMPNDGGKMRRVVKD